MFATLYTYSFFLVFTANWYGSWHVTSMRYYINNKNAYQIYFLSLYNVVFKPPSTHYSHPRGADWCMAVGLLLSLSHIVHIIYIGCTTCCIPVQTTHKHTYNITTLFSLVPQALYLLLWPQGVSIIARDLRKLRANDLIVLHIHLHIWKIDLSLYWCVCTLVYTVLGGLRRSVSSGILGTTRCGQDNAYEYWWTSLVVDATAPRPHVPLYMSPNIIVHTHIYFLFFIHLVLELLGRIFFFLRIPL